MRFIPIGIASEEDFRPVMQASDFSNEHFDGIQLRSSARNDIVLIMHSRKTAPMEWKVVYGFSSVFFASLEEAVAFCEAHGMKLTKGAR